MPEWFGMWWWAVSGLWGWATIVIMPVLAYRGMNRFFDRVQTYKQLRRLRRENL